jgi:germination protein YpeB
MDKLTHFNESGRAHMVEVGDKDITKRTAVARGKIIMKDETLQRIKDGLIKKGDVLSVAQVGGIMGAKKTSELIPMCHNIFLTGADIRFRFIDNGVEVEAEINSTDKTGVEMEALTAVSIACLTIYDMCKAMDRGMEIQDIMLIKKAGGRSGVYTREGNKSLKHVENQMKSFGLINFEERMQEYPELIYDGPFSDHLKDVKPKLAGRKISGEEAVNIISDSFEKHRHSDIKVIGDTENQPIDSYYISISNENTPAGYEATAAVSKIGGEIIWYMDPVLSSKNNINKKDAIKKAEDFLKRIGFNNMEATYSMENEGQMVINFAYKQEDVLIYSDLVKVKLALDDGDIIGLEAQGFLTNHYERNIEKPKISKKEAGKKLSDRVKEENVRLAIIPIAGGKEVLTYEFKVKFGEDHYLIYIDADTGQQRKVLLMVNQENGTLVI